MADPTAAENLPLALDDDRLQWTLSAWSSYPRPRDVAAGAFDSLALAGVYGHLGVQGEAAMVGAQGFLQRRRAGGGGAALARARERRRALGRERGAAVDRRGAQWVEERRLALGRLVSVDGSVRTRQAALALEVARDAPGKQAALEVAAQLAFDEARQAVAGIGRQSALDEGLDVGEQHAVQHTALGLATTPSDVALARDSHLQRQRKSCALVAGSPCESLGARWWQSWGARWLAGGELEAGEKLGEVVAFGGDGADGYEAIVGSDQATKALLVSPGLSVMSPHAPGLIA